MIRPFNVFVHLRRRYQWGISALLLLVAMFVLSTPEVPKGLDYRYQLSERVSRYPLVDQTAGLVRWSTERVREVYRWNLTAETVAQAWPPAKEGTADAVLPATVFILLGAMSMVLIWFSPRYRMTGLGLLVFVLAGSHLGSHPEAYTRLMAWPSTAVPNATVTLVTQAEPGHTLGVEREAATGLKDMADRYFEHYVTFTQHRMGSAGKFFATPKRWWFGFTGLAYVLPFATLLALLAALTTLVQTLAWALAMAAPFGLAVALADGRAGLKVWQHVILPLIASLVLLGALGLVLPMVLFLATVVHAMENEVGLLVVGSVFPLMVVIGGALLVRRMRGGQHAGKSAHALGAETRPAVTHHDPDRTQLLATARHRMRARNAHRRRDRQ